MTIIELIKKYMIENGYSGLVDEWGDCSCCINDLVPCESDFRDCAFVIGTPGGEGQANIAN